MPQKVDDLYQQIKRDNPHYSTSQAWATAWSIFCKNIEPTSSHCKRPRSAYLSSNAHNELKIRTRGDGFGVFRGSTHVAQFSNRRRAQAFVNRSK